MTTANTSIPVNAVTRAINDWTDAVLTERALAAKVRGYRATDKLSVADARTYIQAALLSKVPAYKTQVTERGYPEQDSAYARAVTRMMRDSAPEQDEQTVKAKVRVSRELRELVAAEDARHAKVMAKLRETYGKEAVAAARK